MTLTVVLIAVAIVLVVAANFAVPWIREKRAQRAYWRDARRR